MNKRNLYWLSKNLAIISNICYKITNVMSSNSISILRGWFSTWLCWSLTWKYNLRCWGHVLCAVSFLLRSSYGSFSLKEKVLIQGLIFELEGTLCACSLQSGSSDAFFSFFEEKILVFKAFLLERESLVLESERVFSFESRILHWTFFECSIWRDYSPVLFFIKIIQL